MTATTIEPVEHVPDGGRVEQVAHTDQVELSSCLPLGFELDEARVASAPAEAVGSVATAYG